MNSFFSDIFRSSLKTLCVSEKSRFFHPAYWGHYLDSTGPHNTCVIRVRSSFRENLLQCYCCSTSPTKMAMKYQKNLQKERISQMSTVTSVSDPPASKKINFESETHSFFIFVSLFSCSTCQTCPHQLLPVERSLQRNHSPASCSQAFKSFTT